MTKEEMIENIESITVGLDDTFRFHCTQCGKCCTQRDDIMLSPMDLFRMTKELGISHTEFFSRYCGMIIGQNSRLPIIMLQPVGKDRRCPLLKDNKCTVHKVKPAVCGMFPLGRYLTISPENYGKKPMECSEVKYLLQSPGCGDDSETHTVREWLKDFDIALEDEAFIQWNQAISEFSLVLKDLEKKWDMMTMIQIWFITRIVLYEYYTHDQAFLPQFAANAEFLKSLLKDIPKLKEMIRHARGA